MGRLGFLSGLKGRLFVSYSSADRPQAAGVAQALRNAGFAVFFDRNDLPPGGDYNQRIAKAIEKSDAIICLLSPEFIRPGAYTLSEVAAAEDRWPNAVGRVLPVMMAPTPYASLPRYLGSVTVLEPAGNLESDVVRAVGRLRKWSQGWRSIAAVAAVLIVLAGAGSWYGARHVEQRARELTFTAVGIELESNTRAMRNMSDNTITLAEAVVSVSDALRTPGIKIIAGLFPAENLDTGRDPATLVNLYNERIDWLAESGLLEDEVQVGRATAACAAIARTVERTHAAVRNLTNMDDPRYAIADQAWSANMDRAMRASPQDARDIAAVYADMIDARHSYARVSGSAGAYLDSIQAFCSSGRIDRASLSTALAAERLAFQTLELQLRRTLEIQERSAALLERVKVGSVGGGT